jgi:hypothetical protein
MHCFVAVLQRAHRRFYERKKQRVSESAWLVQAAAVMQQTAHLMC